FTEIVRHARAGTGIGVLGPYPAPLTQQVRRCGTAIAAHAAEGDHTAMLAVVLSQIEHHLIDGWAVGLGPSTAGKPHAAITVEPHLLADRRHDHLAAANRIALPALVDLPLAVAPDRLRQR